MLDSVWKRKLKSEMLGLERHNVYLADYLSVVETSIWDILFKSMKRCIFRIWTILLCVSIDKNGKSILYLDTNNVKCRVVLGRNNNNKTIQRNRKAVALEELSSIEKKIDEGPASPSDTENRLNLLHELEIIDKFPLMDLIQKARVKWDIERDKNTKFFHGLINHKRQNQMINGIMVEGNYITDPSLIKDAFFQFYQVKFQAQDSQFSFPNLPHSETLNSMDRDYLERLMTREEIKEAVWDCGSSKAPGPDGSSFIIAKILANRLSKVIDKIVCKEKSSFIAGRQILDGPIILNHILDSLRFGLKWRSWIKTCLSSSRASILVNGNPTSEFSINRGLRQGDPLSPFLFILVMEGLHNAFADAVGNGLISGNIPFNYLGLPIGSNMKSIASWKMLIDRFRSRLSTWKANLLSIGGRLTLIKSVLGSLGIYYLSIFRAPESVLNDLERIRSNFFWGGNQDGKKMTWVKWSIILNYYDNGGLNIVVKAFHGHEGGFDNNGCSFKGTWANIFGSSNFLHSKGIILNNSFRFNAGCGTRILFWNDIWVGEAPLSIRYNRLYRLDLDKDCLITDLIINGQWHWNWSRTNIGVRNLAFFRDMLNEIGQLNIVASEDTCVWNLGPNGTFTVKDARNIIDQKTLPSLPSTSWDKIIPRKVNIFMWRLSLDRLPHRLNLSLRGMDIPAISCSSCNANVESANHIFFECIIASDLWKLVYRWCEIPFVQALSFEAFKDWLSSWHAPKEKKHRLFIISTSVLWWLWRFRNSVTFNSQPLRKSDIFDYVRSTSFSWLHNRGNLILSWTDWLKSPLMTACLDNG
ncbi:RNA-directed DNA polymerase, eukaryota, reverse transcriptase zinc-binding domain protein [Tanacetum coccineum]